MNAWAQALTELERVDFELGRCDDAASAAAWLPKRAAVLRELAALPPRQAGRSELVRLAQATARGEVLAAQWQHARERIRSEAENLYGSHLLIRALMPEQRSQHFSIES